MKAYLKKLGIGLNTSALFVAGLLTLLLLFRVRKNISAMEYDLLIQKILQGEGYSPEMSRMLAAVARHESANYSSPLFLNHKNFFGMKAAQKQLKPGAPGRPELQDYVAPGEMGYAGFNRAANSVRDMVLYLDYVGAPMHFDSAGALVTFMKSKGYFEAPLSEYINGVERALPKVASL